MGPRFWIAIGVAAVAWSAASEGCLAQANPPPAAPATAAPAPVAPTPVTPKASSPAPKPATSPAEGIPASVVDDRTVETIIGRQISSHTGEDMGPIVNMFVDGEGRVRAALIDFGGFLGVGSRQIAVDWRALHFAADGKDNRITVSLTRNQIRLAPAYKEGQPLVILGAPIPPPAAPAPATGAAAAPAPAADGSGAKTPPPAAPATPASPPRPEK